MNTILLFSSFLLSFHILSPCRQVDGKQESTQVLQDTVMTKKILKAVRSHILSVTKDRRRPLVVKEGKKSRRFIVMEFLATVSVNKGLYTAQVDADEFDHKIPRILYVDVKPFRKSFRVTHIRIGPNHFRNKGGNN